MGKPVESLGMTGRKDLGLNGRQAIKHYLQNRGHWPLDDYFSGAEAPDGIRLQCMASWREHIAFMEPDDDIHYTIISLMAALTHEFLASTITGCSEETHRNFFAKRE